MENEKTTIEQVRAIVAEAAGIDMGPPTDDQRLFYDAASTNSDAHRTAGGYGLDSLDAVEIAMGIEDAEFAGGIELTDSEIGSDEFQTVAGIAALVDRKLQEAR